MSVRISKPALVDDLHAAHEVIEASAGTGKTYTLQRLVADLIVRGVSTIDRILVVTFTEKATQELRTRIRGYLQEVHDRTMDDDLPPFWEVDAEAHGRLSAALRGFERASISTIHGFCRQVLQESALLRCELEVWSGGFDSGYASCYGGLDSWADEANVKRFDGFDHASFATYLPHHKLFHGAK